MGLANSTRGVGGVTAAAIPNSSIVRSWVSVSGTLTGIGVLPLELRRQHVVVHVDAAAGGPVPCRVGHRSLPSCGCRRRRPLAGIVPPVASAGRLVIWDR